MLMVDKRKGKRQKMRGWRMGGRTGTVEVCGSVVFALQRLV